MTSKDEFQAWYKEHVEGKSHKPKDPWEETDKAEYLKAIQEEIQTGSQLIEKYQGNFSPLEDRVRGINKDFDRYTMDDFYEPELPPSRFDDAADAMSYQASVFDRIKQSREAKRELHQMSNKFLPFIVESSTPLSIWTTILARSKGMDHGLIVSMFNLTMNYGVQKLRTESKQLPDMDTTDLYAKLMDMHPNYRVDNELLRIFTGMCKYCSKSMLNEHVYNDVTVDLSPEQVFQFLFPLCSNELPLSEYTSLPLDHAIDMEHIFKFISDHLKFADDGKEVEFKTADEFKSWCLYMITLSEIDTDSPFSTNDAHKVRFK